MKMARDEVRTVRPVAREVVGIGSLAAGEWCLYRGNYYLYLGGGLLTGAIGSADVRVSPGDSVQRVEIMSL